MEGLYLAKTSDVIQNLFHSFLNLGIKHGFPCIKNTNVALQCVKFHENIRNCARLTEQTGLFYEINYFQFQRAIIPKLSEVRGLCHAFSCYIKFGLSFMKPF